MAESGATPYCGVLLPEEPTIEQVRTIVPDYTTMLLEAMAALADRFERRADYPFLDTKLDLLTGRDFPPGDPIRGPDAIYGWIQGRGLEAVASHCLWLHRRGLGSALLPRLARTMEQVLHRLRAIRARNAGRLFFFMTPAGEPFILDDDGRPQAYSLASDAPWGYSDLFCAKGMYAAARVLGDVEAAAETRAYCQQADEAVWQGNFASDQQPLDPANAVRAVPGRHIHGPYMIQIGAAALLADLDADPGSVEQGLRLIRRQLGHHVNLGGRIAALEEGDFWEAVDEDGQPYREDGRILSDPGHALECVGLTLKFAAAVRRHNLATVEQSEELTGIEAKMPAVLQRNFANGFQAGPGGICKAFDLVSREALNTDMPWWSLPETMRAALYCWKVASDDTAQQSCLNILSACHNAFVRHYVLLDRHLMAVQTRSREGRPVPVIPATADVDPGYHTGLSMIDVLDML